MSVSNVYRINFHYDANGLPVPKESFQSAVVVLANSVAEGYGMAADNAAVMSIISILASNGFNPPSGSVVKIDAIIPVVDRILA